MNHSVDMVAFVAELVRRPRSRAAIVFTHDYAGQHAWAAELARQTDAQHYPLLDIFSNPAHPWHPSELSRHISLMTVSEVFTMVQRHSQAPVAIISALEFIKATWVGQTAALAQFASSVQNWHNTPAMLFVMQVDATLADYNFGRRYNYRFTVDQRDTLKL